MHAQSGLKMMVYPLMIYPFAPEENEMHFFGQMFGLWFAFETTGYQEHQQPYVDQAMQWYAEKKMWPQILPTMVDPRTPKEHKRVN
jgi:hypothetical protein